MKKENVLEIISKCTDCGAPIYGAKEIKINEEPIVKFNCECRFKSSQLIYILPYQNQRYDWWVGNPITWGNVIGVGNDAPAIAYVSQNQ